MISARSPAWMTYSGRWGDSEASVVPGEKSSPRGPAFQPDKWDHPAKLEASARECGSVAPGRPWQWPLVAALAILAAVLLASLARSVRGRQ